MVDPEDPIAKRIDEMKEHQERRAEPFRPD